MSYEQKAELLQWLIPLVFGQLTLLLVAVIHAWASANRGREIRSKQDTVEQQVAEIKGTVETLKGTGNGEVS